MQIVNPFSVPDLLTFVIPFFIVLIIAEIGLIIYKWKKTYDYKEAMASIGTGIGVAIFNVLMKAIYLTVFFSLFQFRLFKNFSPGGDFFQWHWHLAHWYLWVILFFLDDLTFYWFHRFSHEIRLFWAGHVSHHSSQDYNFATSLRQGLWEIVFKYAFWCWLPLIGFHPFMIYLVMQVNLSFQLFTHTETVRSLGFLEKFMNTPSHHRVHHGSDIKYLDRNYGGVFIIWDKLFGTFQTEEEKPNYGLTNNINSKNPLVIFSHEPISLAKDFHRAKKWSDKLKYLYYGPGWSHDGEDKRAKVLQQKNV